jgi:hypothetical protein
MALVYLYLFVKWKLAWQPTTTTQSEWLLQIFTAETTSVQIAYSIFFSSPAVVIVLEDSWYRQAGRHAGNDLARYRLGWIQVLAPCVTINNTTTHLVTRNCLHWWCIGDNESFTYDLAIIQLCNVYRCLHLSSTAVKHESSPFTNN